MRHLISKWWNDIFRYPQKQIHFQPESHDVYWERRGTNPAEGFAPPSLWQKERGDFVLSVLKKEQKEKIVCADIGSGNGSTLRYLASAIPNMEGIGIDGSSVMLKEIQRSGFTAVSADVSDPGFVPPPCDYALMFEIVEHVPLSERLIAASLETARRGVFVSFPNSGFFTYRLRLLFGKFPSQWLFHPSEHVRFWTLADVRWWLRACGWEGAVVHSYQGVPFLNRLLPGLFAAGIVLYIPKES